MDISHLLHEFAAYDLWANTRLVDRLLREPEELLDEPAKSSFASIRATLMHIRNAHAVWLARITGTTPRWPAADTEALATFLPHVLALHDHVKGLMTADLLGKVNYTDLKGNAYVQPRAQLLMHCFNHGTYHRGQVVTQMRALDLQEIPALDLVVFQRLRM